MMDQGAGHRGACPHPAAERGDDRFAPVGQLDELQRLVDVCLGAVDRGKEAQVLLDREIGIKRGRLGHVPDARQHAQVGDPPAEYSHRPRVGLDQTDQASDQRGLAGTVRPEQPVDLTATDPQADPVKGAQPPESLGDILDLNGVLRPRAHRAAIPRTQVMASSLTASNRSP